MKAETIDALHNIGLAVSVIARQYPEQIAVAEPASRVWPTSKFRAINFAELDRRSNQIALGLLENGVRQGSRMSLMIPPGIDFVCFVFGLLKAGTNMILIDPGMGLQNMLRCLVDAEPEGLVGIGRAHYTRLLFRGRFANCKLNFLLGRAPVALTNTIRVSDFWRLNSTAYRPVEHDREQPAAVIFTSGSTGPPKGVLYRHRNFLEQTIQIRDYFGIQPGGTDVSGFPLFALFNAAMATTTVFPKMDSTRPASVNPKNVIHAVNRFGANQSFGSPALWNTVATYCELRKVRLPTLRRVLTAGAPIPSHVLQRIRATIAEDGKVFTPYGATEALPVACIESRDVLYQTASETARGRGICVGQKFPRIDWQIIEIDDGPILDISQARKVERGTIGELIVRGPVVTDQYVTGLNANPLHKIADGSAVWHRMGDVGYFDERDRFWFCGRKSQRVKTSADTMFTIPCEGILNTHAAIYRSALVGVGQPGRHVPAFVAEPWPQHWPKPGKGRTQLIGELRELAHRFELTRGVQHFFLMRNLPVDTRHNAKIFREKLAVWTAQQLKRK